MNTDTQVRVSQARERLQLRDFEIIQRRIATGTAYVFLATQTFAQQNWPRVAIRVDDIQRLAIRIE